MTDQKGCKAKALTIISDHFKHAKLTLGVKPRGRLVKEHHLGLCDQRAPQRHSLLHPSRKLARVAIR